LWGGAEGHKKASAGKKKRGWERVRGIDHKKMEWKRKEKLIAKKWVAD